MTNYEEVKCQSSGVTKITLHKYPRTSTEKKNRRLKFGIFFKNFEKVEDLLAQNDFSKIFSITVTQSQSKRRMRILEAKERLRRKNQRRFNPQEKKFKILFEPQNNRNLQTTASTATVSYYLEGSNSAIMDIKFDSSLDKANFKISVDQPYLTYNEQQFPISKIEQTEEVDLVILFFLIKEH